LFIAREVFFTLEMGARLRAIREKVGMNKGEVAARMGLSGRVSGKFIGHLESGRIGNPSVKTMALFLRAGRPPEEERAGRTLPALNAPELATV